LVADGFAAALVAAGLVADGFAAVLVAAGLVADGFAAVLFAPAPLVDAALALDAPARRVPIRSGRVDGSAASTPFSSRAGFDLDFFGFSTLSAMPLRVYGSRSGRGARPPSFRHKNHFAAPSCMQWVALACSRD
jgi:hypothetical protein